MEQASACISPKTANNHGQLFLREFIQAGDVSKEAAPLELRCGNPESRQFILRFHSRRVYTDVASLSRDGQYSFCVELESLFKKQQTTRFNSVTVEMDDGTEYPLMSVTRRAEGKNIIFECCDIL